MIRYVITSAPGEEATRLSRAGMWGNVPHACETDARRAAEADARGEPFTIERERGARRMEVQHG